MGASPEEQELLRSFDREKGISLDRRLKVKDHTIRKPFFSRDGEVVYVTGAGLAGHFRIDLEEPDAKLEYDKLPLLALNPQRDHLVLCSREQVFVYRIVR